MNELSLFAGGGGGILGGRLLGWRTVCAVEWEPYCQAVLLARQTDGLLERFPIWDDVQTFEGAPWRGRVDVITAGFPCQPFSTAGKRQGEADERNMWPSTIRIIREVGPEWCLLENVPGLVTSGYFGTIVHDLAEAGFDAEWGVFSAFECGAPHLRQRLWIVAHARGQQHQGGPHAERRKTAEDDMADAGCTRIHERWINSDVIENGEKPRGIERNGLSEVDEKKASDADPHGAGFEEFQGLGTDAGAHGRNEPDPDGWWSVEPNVGRVANGVAHRVDRLMALGNGQVPVCAAMAFKVLSERFLK